jgi:Zn-dependent alcohol dehydrogenase
VPINPHVITRKQLKIYGSWAFAEPQYARYVDTLPLLAAQFDLSRLVTRYPLAEVNQALEEMASGTVMKAVLAPDSAM